MNFKFGHLINNQSSRYYYNNTFAHDVYPSWSRLTIGPKDNQIPLMLEIAKSWGGPYGILYVLSTPRLGYNAARYQSPEPCSYDDLELFAYTFQEFFEGDGRHHIWFMDVNSNKQIIYDNHNILYAYGDDDSIIKLLKENNFTRGEVSIPAPHEHLFNQENDTYEDEIMGYFEWIEFPLQEEHDE